MGNLPMKFGAVRPKPVKRSFDLSNDSPQIDVKKPKLDVVETLQLIDINDHCLWHTFEFLDDLVDLVKIAEAHERFIPAAVFEFRRRYRKRKELIVNLGSMHYRPIDCCECPVDENMEPFFRHFGHLITNALINFMGRRQKQSHEIGTLLQDFCADTIVELDLACLDSDDFQSIDKPFTKLEKLTFIDSTMGQKLSQMNIWFPQIQSLELIYVKLSQPELFEVNLPHLKHLEIYNRQSDMPIQTISEMLRANPQLKSLSLCCDYDRRFIESLSQNVPELEELELWTPQDRFLSFNDDKIHFGTVKKFKLNACMSRGDFLVNIPFTFDDLQELTFDGFNQFKGQILDFIVNRSTVKKLKLVPYIDDFDDLMPQHLREITDSLPMLTELEFCADMLNMDEIVRLLADSEKLTNVVLLFVDALWCKEFEHKLRFQWDLSKQISGNYTSTGIIDYVQLCLKRKNPTQ